jgi:hypothetical protein
VITITNGKWEGPDPSQDLLIDGVRRDHACKKLLDKGANVVGLNCFAGMKVWPDRANCGICSAGHVALYESRTCGLRPEGASGSVARTLSHYHGTPGVFQFEKSRDG